MSEFWSPSSSPRTVEESDIVSRKVLKDDLAHARAQLAMEYAKGLTKKVDVASHDEAKLWGMVGQTVAARALHVGAFELSTTDYDLWISGRRVEVKTRHTSVKGTSAIDLSYRAVVRDDALKRQQCDGYLFSLLNLDVMKLWLVGWIPKQEFLRKSVFQKKGDLFDDSDRFQVLGDCWALEYRELRPVRSLQPGVMTK